MTLLQEAGPLAEVKGSIIDADSHEMVPAHLWSETFGKETELFAQLVATEHVPGGINSLVAELSQRDEGPITNDLPSWQAGAAAPGAYNLARRLEWLDLCGVSRQYIFPTGPGLYGMLFLTLTPERAKELLGLEVPAEVLRAQGLANLSGYNGWAIKVSQFSDRFRPVGVLDTTDLAEAVAGAEYLISHGIRAISIPAGIPVGGFSPGNPETDPLWEFLAESNVPLLLHVGGDFTFLASSAWGLFGAGYDQIINMSGKKSHFQEVPLGPYAISQLGLGCQNFVSTMVFGGTFERHPNLRVGCIETGANWIGPLVENMEQVGSQYQRWAKQLSLSPREYVKRNVRVTGFHWEPIDQYIERYGLEDVYAYGSDYPHYEGGRDPAAIYAAKLGRLGPDILQKFFVDNAAFLWAD